jgi:hypothetical protein
MKRVLKGALTALSIASAIALIGTASCVHAATDRVLEPAGGQDASASPPGSPLTDAGTTPLGPVAEGDTR